MHFACTDYLHVQRKVTGIQSWSRSVSARHAYNARWQSAITIQTGVRGNSVRGVLHAMTKAVVVIQVQMRMFFSVRHYKLVRRNKLVSMHKGVSGVQRLWQGHVQQTKYNSIINKVSMIQAETRMNLGHTDFLQRQIIGIQRWYWSVGAQHTYKVRQRKSDRCASDVSDKDRTTETSKGMEKQLIDFENPKLTLDISYDIHQQLQGRRVSDTQPYNHTDKRPTLVTTTKRSKIFYHGDKPSLGQSRPTHDNPRKQLCHTNTWKIKHNTSA